MNNATQNTVGTQLKSSKEGLMTYALATGLVGFSSSTLRVRVLRREAGCVWVCTADLRDAGTRLVLNETQVSPEPQAPSAVSYKSGLVTFAE